MRFFNKVQNIHNPKVHPLSKTVVDNTAKMLEGYGITDKLTQAKIALALFQATIKHMKEIAKSKQDDSVLQRQADELKSLLKKYGIESEETQENMVLEYLDVIGKLG